MKKPTFSPAEHAKFARITRLAELSGAAQMAVETLHLLRDLISRGETGEPLQLSFTATAALTRMLETTAQELYRISEALADS